MKYLVILLALLASPFLTGCGTCEGDKKMEEADKIAKNGDLLITTQAYYDACIAYQEKSDGFDPDEIKKKLEKAKEKLDKNFAYILSSIAERTFNRHLGKRTKTKKFRIQHGLKLAEKVGPILGGTAGDRLKAVNDKLKEYQTALEKGMYHDALRNDFDSSSSKIDLLNELFE